MLKLEVVKIFNTIDPNLHKYAQKSIEQYKKEKSDFDSFTIKMRDKITEKTLHQLFEDFPDSKMAIPLDEQDTPNFVIEDW